VPAFPEPLAALARTLFPGSELVSVERLRPDEGRERAQGQPGEAAPERAGGTGGREPGGRVSPRPVAEKAIGYGDPIKVTVREPGGATRAFVFRTEVPNEFGHDRRSDRMDEALVAWDLFNRTPRHVRALDVGAVGADGRLVSLRGTGEPYLVTEWIEGSLYADDLRRIARDAEAGPLDHARAAALADYLVALHAERVDDPAAWRRAVRDLLGHGEGIFGMVDGYPEDTPAAPPGRLRAIEERCLAWRWRLRGRAGRLARTHGDFHPFNVLFRPGGDGTALALLDASRGGRGDPADDLTALSVNYVLFAAEHRRAWGRALRGLWRGFWERWLAGARDPEALETAPPFLAWRALVVASPRFYPGLSPEARDLLLSLAERALDAGRLDLDLPDRLLGEGA